MKRINEYDDWKAEPSWAVNRMQYVLAKRVRAAKRRLRADGKPLCDLCGIEAGDQRHHIFTRYLTMANEAATAYANSHRVNALLCQSCHDEADTIENRDRLLLTLYDLYGYAEVRGQWLLIKATMGSTIPMLPVPKGRDTWQKRNRKTRMRPYSLALKKRVRT